METVNQEEKTFTQAEVDKIVSERLTRDRARYSDYDDLKAQSGQFEETKTELQKANERAAALQSELDSMKNAESLRLMREKVSKNTNVPAMLLTGATEEECLQQAQNIIEYAKPTYPNVRDGGEAHAVSKPTTRQQFAEWFNTITN